MSLKLKGLFLSFKIFAVTCYLMILAFIQRLVPNTNKTKNPPPIQSVKFLRPENYIKKSAHMAWGGRIFSAISFWLEDRKSLRRKVRISLFSLGMSWIVLYIMHHLDHVPESSFEY